jgi:endonuclease YncB( thermonuclease family)
VVDHVVDGDTLDVRIGGRFQRVRTVQIDAPESSSTRYGHPDKCGAPAKRFAKSLTAPGRTVTLQFAGEDRTDSYGRLLAIVHLGGALALTWQERMVRSGWADVLIVQGNRTPLLPALRRDAAYAKAHRLGVWGVCGGHFHDPTHAALRPYGSLGRHTPSARPD